MATQVWTYISNPFLNATRTSYLRALIVGNYTDGALQGNPALQALYTQLHPLVAQYSSRYNSWRTQAGTQKSKTAGLNALLATATEKINDWDYRVQGTIRKTNPAYKGIFPNGHAPFQQGSQQGRIEAVESLSKALNEAGLDELATEVKEYYLSLKAADATQKSAIGQTGQDSSDLEAARVALCEELYAVLGGLMQQFKRTPEAIKNYFKLELIRNRAQKSFTGHLQAGEVHLVAQRTLGAEEEISLLNGGAERLVFFLSDHAETPAPPPAGTGVTVEAGTEQTVPATRLGAVETAHYLYVYNPGTAVGDWEVDI